MTRLTPALLVMGLVVGSSAYAERSADISKAREALAQTDEDSTQEKSLEEVFEATENRYSLMKKGQSAMNYSLSYSYMADQRLSVEIANNQIRSFDVNASNSHTLTNNISFDYGLMNNLTLGGTVPLVAKYDSADNIGGSGLGDISFNGRWQPYAYIPGEMTKTVTGSFKTHSGDSPFETISGKKLPTGSGYYSLSGGMSISKVVDPVMLFGSSSFSYGIPLKEINQNRDGALLMEVHPGPSLAFSGGFAHSLSYDVSLSMSFQGSYTDKTTYVFKNGGGTRTKAESQASMSGVLNFGLGIRVSPKTITNVGVGFGMTEDSPDILLSLSMPIDVNGLKAKLLPSDAS